MWDVFAWLGLITAIAAILFVLALALGVVVARRKKKKVFPNTVLELELDHAPPETFEVDPFSQLLRPQRLTLRGLTDALDRAAEDERVKGLVVKLGLAGLPLADAEEIRAALMRFRAKGKFAVAWADSMGDHRHGNSLYFLASAFDEIHLQSGGSLSLLGFSASVPFLKKAFDRIGVVPQLGHREEYKAFKYLFTEEEYTPPHRENAEAILRHYYDRTARAVAEGRNLTLERAKELLDGGPYSAAEARDLGLIDGISYRDEVYAAVRDRVAGEKTKLLFLSRYIEKAVRPVSKGKHKIALIHGVGGVKPGRSKPQRGPGSGPVMGAATVCESFRAAVADKNVKAIVFRVSSPGGSAVASETIWREVVRAREAGKPVIVSMGAVAGSGGYYVAMPADRIFAHPTTLTGSIGVFGGKIALGRLWEKLGVSWDWVLQGRNADFYDANREFTPEQWKMLDKHLDEIYEDFVGKVAQARGFTREQAMKVAKGRVWTGEEALENGLVDALGGLHDAIHAARERGGVPERARIRLQVFPTKRSLFAKWRRRENSEDFSTASALSVDNVESAATAWLERIASEGIARLSPLSELLDLTGPEGALRVDRWVSHLTRAESSGESGPPR